jgi:predicted RNase H-like nuclease
VLGNFATGEVRLLDLPLKEILDLPERPAIITVDVPIGLPEVTLPGGRTCDQLARGLLGPRRGSVFSPMGRICLQVGTRENASWIHKNQGGIGIGAHCWGLKGKLVEIDTLITPAKQGTVYEIHPEVTFREMNGEQPLTHHKKTTEGERQRIEVLMTISFPEPFLAKLGTLRGGRDDFLDACAALWTAQRIYRGIAKRLPDKSERDQRGLDMAIWF